VLRQVWGRLRCIAIIAITMASSAANADLTPFAVRAIAPDVRVRTSPSAISVANIGGYADPEHVWDVYEVVPGPDERGRIRDWYRAVNRSTGVDRFVASWMVKKTQIVTPRQREDVSAPAGQRRVWFRAGFIIAVLGVAAAFIALLTAIFNLHSQVVTAALSRDTAVAQLEIVRVAQDVVRELNPHGRAGPSALPKERSSVTNIVPFKRNSATDDVRARLGIAPRRTRSS
jgi:hypothetical protein